MIQIHYAYCGRCQNIRPFVVQTDGLERCLKCIADGEDNIYYWLPGSQEKGENVHEEISLSKVPIRNRVS